LNPYEHGECYVTDDGAETDLDLGHYERFLNIPTSQSNNVTTGRIYNNIITKERKGEFLGKTVQVVPHITDEIKRNFYLLGETGKYDFVITEIGGCVGDIESLPFIEAVRQAKWELGADDSLVIHLTLIPYLKTAGELKTKPTQHSVKTLLEAGIQPDILVCRTEYEIPHEIRRKLALFCNVHIDSVIESIDAETIYDVPLLMKRERLDDIVLHKLRLIPRKELDLTSWNHFLTKLKNPKRTIQIALVGKYVDLRDAYKSIAESFIHAGAALETGIDINWIHSEDLESNEVAPLLENADGILVAPGFGERGINGKIEAIKYARENKVPFLGICLGMQMAVVEIARNVLGWADAASTEMDAQTKHSVICMMESQKKIRMMGGTMRLGAYDCRLEVGSKLAKAYGTTIIQERHRHRYEFNSDFLEQFKSVGFRAVGVNPDNHLVEAMELDNHPWFVGVQYHPEYKSRVEAPHPLFMAFVQAAVERKKLVSAQKTISELN
jgi:CTP synthase